MAGTSPALQEIFSHIRQVAATEIPVLITGESGTGKELAALAIHERSRRAHRAFVPINCAAIPGALLESELFGHERGAFTGAHRSTRGLVESAHGGTLFLDEVGELATPLQAKLLRFLEDQMVERLGGGKRHRVDVRLISATNLDLSQATARSCFRTDLYYRLAVFNLHMPPLRDRADDAVLIARVFLKRHAEDAGRSLRDFAPDAIAALRSWRWPGNVRELLNRVQRAVVVSREPLVAASDLGFGGEVVETRIPTLREAQLRTEAHCLGLALECARGNRSVAARMLGVSRSTFYELLRRHGGDSEVSALDADPHLGARSPAGPR
jgi:two-component system NtrC family response regulator